MNLAICTLAYNGTIVWTHHLYTVGIEIDTRTYFMVATTVIALPTGSKMYNYFWSLTTIGKALTVMCQLRYVVLFLVTFNIGGLSGLILS